MPNDPTMDRALSASWLSTRWGVDTVRINAMRRAGELLAVRQPGTTDWRYPAWQFDADGGLRPEVRRVLGLAHARGLDGDGLNQFLQRRSGMTGRARLVDELLAGRVDHVEAALASATTPRER
jgi:hypothetical protein